MSALTVIVKTKVAGYRSPVTRERVKIGEFMYTADIDERDRTELEDDENVAAIAYSQHLPLQKLP